MKRLWIIPLSVFLLGLVAGSLAKWVFVLPRGAFLWDTSLILLSASIFGTEGFIIAWAIFSPEGDTANDDKR